MTKQSPWLLLTALAVGGCSSGMQVSEDTGQEFDLAALIEAVLEDDAGFEFFGARFVGFEPEEFVALKAGSVAGFREAGLRVVGRHDRNRMSDAASCHSSRRT